MGPQLALRLCCRIGNFRKRRDALNNLRRVETYLETRGPLSASKQRTHFQKVAKHSHLLAEPELPVR
jgi:hypothetical protein